MSENNHFSGRLDRFERNIYASAKGAIRLQVLWHHLQAAIPELTRARLHILDAGCGPARIDLKLAEQGHALMLTDIAEPMLQQARKHFMELHPEAAVQYGECSIYHLGQRYPEQYDLVLCHAVLEWLEQPQQAIIELVKCLRPGGIVSLMFYNCDALIFRNLIRGNLRKVASGQYAGHQGGLTPTRPLHLAAVREYLEQAGLEIASMAGVRTFYDYLTRQARERLSLQDIVQMEIEFSQRQPYCGLARYLHLVCRRPVSD